MKRKTNALIWSLCAVVALGGCAVSKKSDTGNADMDTDTVLKGDAGETADPADTEEAFSAEEGSSNTADTSDARDLTTAELQKFTDWINEGDNGGNYGFLLSDYRDPKDADLGEIFYSGAGMATEPLTAAERQEYLKISGREDIETDCVRLTTEQINRVLTKRLGCTLDEMSQELPWFYLEKAKVWVTEHGDTNYVNFTCVSGRELSAGVYELDCVPGDENYRPYVHSCHLTLQAEGEDYRILSNVFDDSLTYSKSIYQIDNQSFKVDLGGSWGEVIFTSYAPGQTMYGNQDVSFSLVQDNAEIYDFPGITENGYRDPLLFQEVLAVSFQDYDGDGQKDVIIICSYDDLYGEPGNRISNEVRLYQNMGYSFRLDSERMDWLNANGFHNNIDEVMAHVKDEMK